MRAQQSGEELTMRKINGQLEFLINRKFLKDVGTLHSDYCNTRKLLYFCEEYR